MSLPVEIPVRFVRGGRYGRHGQPGTGPGHMDPTCWSAISFVVARFPSSAAIFSYRGREVRWAPGTNFPILDSIALEVAEWTTITLRTEGPEAEAMRSALVDLLSHPWEHYAARPESREPWRHFRKARDSEPRPVQRESAPRPALPQKITNYSIG